MANDERKKWRGRLLHSGEGTFRPVDADERPHPQVAQGLTALRKAQRPTLRARDGQRFGQPATSAGPAEVHRLPQRRGEPDTAPGRPPGNPPEPTVTRDPEVAPTDLGWGTAAPANPVAAAARGDELVTVSRSELDGLVAAAVRNQLGPIAMAISEIRAHMTEGASVTVPSEGLALPQEPIALLPILDDAPPREPVVALTIPDEHDWTQGRAEEFALPPAPAQAQG